jgi:hypothetical protein
MKGHISSQEESVTNLSPSIVTNGAGKSSLANETSVISPTQGVVKIRPTQKASLTERYTLWYDFGMAAKKLTAVRIDQADLGALAKIGQREDRTQSYLINLAIKEFVARRGKKK